MPAITTTTVGANVTFSVTVTAGVNVSYQWSFNGSALSGQTNSAYTRTILSTDNAKQVCVLVSSSCGSPLTCCAAINSCTPPVITCQPKGSAVCSGSAITSLTVTATGAAPLSYQWYHNGSKVTNQTNSAYSDLHSVSSDGGNYYVIVSNACGSATSCTVSITINTPPVLTCQPYSITVCSSQPSCGGYCNVCPDGGEACFSVCVQSSGSCNFSYQWLENGKPVSDCYNLYSGSKTADFCVLNTSGKNGYKYSVIVTNSCGSALLPALSYIWLILLLLHLNHRVYALMPVLLLLSPLLLN